MRNDEMQMRNDDVRKVSVTKENMMGKLKRKIARKDDGEYEGKTTREELNREMLSCSSRESAEGAASEYEGYSDDTESVEKKRIDIMMRNDEMQMRNDDVREVPVTKEKMMGELKKKIARKDDGEYEGRTTREELNREMLSCSSRESAEGAASEYEGYIDDTESVEKERIDIMMRNDEMQMRNDDVREVPVTKEKMMGELKRKIARKDDGEYEGKTTREELNREMLSCSSRESTEGAASEYEGYIDDTKSVEKERIDIMMRNDEMQMRNNDVREVPVTKEKMMGELKGKIARKDDGEYEGKTTREELNREMLSCSSRKSTEGAASEYEGYIDDVESVEKERIDIMMRNDEMQMRNDDVREVSVTKENMMRELKRKIVRKDDGEYEGKTTREELNGETFSCSSRESTEGAASEYKEYSDDEVENFEKERIDWCGFPETYMKELTLAIAKINKNIDAPYYSQILRAIKLHKQYEL
ncbi:M protein, serotype 6-like [Watersipora subatra]|uniref:M protein, serotype 6-like n=1 Tax=Watersipora subatra TaxID=2589382 RepID=UPI00355C6D2D